MRALLSPLLRVDGAAVALVWAVVRSDVGSWAEPAGVAAGCTQRVATAVVPAGLATARAGAGLAAVLGVLAGVALATGAALAGAGEVLTSSGAAGAAVEATGLAGSSCSRMKARTLGYTMSRQRRPLKMP